MKQLDTLAVNLIIIFSVFLLNTSHAVDWKKTWKSEKPVAEKECLSRYKNVKTLQEIYEINDFLDSCISDKKQGYDTMQGNFGLSSDKAIRLKEICSKTINKLSIQIRCVKNESIRVPVNKEILKKCDFNSNGLIDGIFDVKLGRASLKTSIKETKCQRTEKQNASDMMLLKEMIQSGKNLEHKNKKGETPLIKAGYHNNVEAIKILLDAGAKIDAQDNEGATSLMNASYKGHIELVEFLLKRGANPNIAKSSGYTALSFAVQEGKTSVVSELIQAGAKPNKKELFLATDKPINLKILKMLINAGAKVNNVNYNKVTPLIKVSSNITLDEETAILTIQLKQNISVNLLNYKNKYNKSNHDNLEAVKLLIAAGADVNVQDESKDTPLIKAASYNSDSEIIKTLIDSGSNINVKGGFGATALHNASENLYAGSLHIVHALIQAGANVDAKDDEGKTPLHYAAKNNFDKNALDKIRALISASAKVSVRDNYGNTLLHSASYNTFEVASILIKAGVDIQARGQHGDYAINGFAKNEDLRIIKLLINKGANIHSVNDNGVTPLHSAALGNSNPKVILELIKVGADVNAKADKTSGYNEFTPLHYAAGSWFHDDNVDVIRTLIKAGANTNARDTEGNTPLDYAKKKNKGNLIIDALTK